MQRLKAGPVAKSALRGLAKSAITAFHKRRQSSHAIAVTLGQVQLRAGDWRWSRVDQRIRAVTAAQVQAFARKYLVKPADRDPRRPAEARPRVFGGR